MKTSTTRKAIITITDKGDGDLSISLDFEPSAKADQRDMYSHLAMHALEAIQEEAARLNAKEAQP